MMPTALVTGATSQIGHFLLPRLQEAGFTVTAISRQPPPGIIWQKSDLLKSPFLKQYDYLFHLAPLTLLPLLNETAFKRIIAFSSTSCFSKVASSDPKERAIAAQLTEAESILKTVNIAWTIFRPTLIYGCGIDKNVSFIAKFIHRFGFFPIAGEGLRQPVHADDLAAACVQACQSEKTINKAYNLSGGQTLSYREMVESIFQQLGKTPRIIKIKPSLFKLLIRGIAYFPPFAHLSTAMIERMTQDLCFDHSAATQDFAYSPRNFNQD